MRSVISEAHVLGKNRFDSRRASAPKDKSAYPGGPPAGRPQLQDLLAPLTLQHRAAALQPAAARLWNTLDLGEPAAREYFRQSAATLAPRLDVALTHHTLEGMFVTF